MKAQEHLDRVMHSCTERMQEEVSALLGKSLTFSQPETVVLSKEELFSQAAGRTVLAHVQVEGDIEGEGAILLDVRDAIRIGGTLIMLPDSELESAISEEEYTEELEDSYGEIANIICGSLTGTFDEQYPRSVRLVRTRQEVILPVKVDIDSDEPVPDGSYYLMTTAMRLEDQEMGSLRLLLPAAPFGLVEEPRPEAATEAEGAGEEAAAASTGQGQERPEAPAPGASRPDAGKQRELVDRLLAACAEKVSEDVGALLGGELKIRPGESGIHTKEGVLDQLGGRQVLARLEVRGEGEGEAFLFSELKDAIYLGGTLIMLPEPELEEVVRNEDFGEDARDAYGEIANIIAGAYTSVFEEQYRRKLGFVRTEMEVVVPVRIDPDTDETIPAQRYYLSVGSIDFNGNELGLLHFAIPADLLELEELPASGPQPDAASGPVEAGEAAGSAAGDARGSVRGIGDASGGVDAAAAGSPHPEDPVDIMIVTDDDTGAENMATFLDRLGYTSRILHFRDPLNSMLTSSVRLVFLVMREVNEQGFGVAIKITGSGCSVPLVAAGPAWTRTAVLKAVKYGACDILITPAGEEDIREKIETNLSRIAA